jgi:hypothetical protein
MDDASLRAERAYTRSPFLNTRQASHFLGLSPRLLERMRTRAFGPPFRRHGRFVRYHIDDLINGALNSGSVRSDG